MKKTKVSKITIISIITTLFISLIIPFGVFGDETHQFTIGNFDEATDNTLISSYNRYNFYDVNYTVKIYNDDNILLQTNVSKVTTSTNEKGTSNDYTMEFERSTNSNYPLGYYIKLQLVTNNALININNKNTFEISINGHITTYNYDDGYKIELNVEFQLSPSESSLYQLLNYLQSNSVIQEPIYTPTPSIVLNDNRIGITYPILTPSEFGDGYRFILHSPIEGETRETTGQFFEINAVGTYYVTLAYSDNNGNHQYSFPSNEVYFDGRGITTLETPTLTNNGNTISWNAINGATSYDIYCNGIVIDGTITSLSKNVSQSGYYQVQARGNNALSNLSNMVYITVANNSNPINPSVPSMPSEPTNANIIEWIKYFIDTIDYYISTIVNGIYTIFADGVNAISNLSKYINQFVSNFGDLFGFIPQELKVLIISVITIMMVFIVIKAFRG